MPSFSRPPGRPVPLTTPGDAVALPGYTALTLTRLVGECVTIGDPNNPIAIIEFATAERRGRVRMRVHAPTAMRIGRLSQAELAALADVESYQVPRLPAREGSQQEPAAQAPGTPPAPIGLAEIARRAYLGLPVNLDELRLRLRQAMRWREKVEVRLTNADGTSNLAIESELTKLNAMIEVLETRLAYDTHADTEGGEQ